MATVVWDMLQRQLYVQMKLRNQKKVDIIRYVMAEIQRNPIGKDYNDPAVILTIKRVIGQLKEVVKENTVEEITFLENEFLPAITSDEEIIEAINKIDFTQFRNKFEAIKILLKQFPVGSVDGMKIKELIIQLGK